MNVMFRSVGFGAVLSIGLAGCSTTKGTNAQSTANWPQAAQKVMGNPRDPNVPQTVVLPGAADVPASDEARNPGNVFVAYGRWQEQQKLYPQARESYLKALEEDHKLVEAILGLSRIDQATGQKDEAEKQLQKAQRLRPKDPLVMAAWGEFYASQERWPEAIERYRKAAELAPEVAIYQHQLAVLITRSGDVEGGLQAFTRIVTRGEAHYNIAYLLHSQGQSAEAEQHLQRALKERPELVQARTLLTKIQKERSASVAAVPTITPAPQQPTAPALNGPSPWSQQSNVEEFDVQPASFSVPATPTRPTPQQLEQRQNQQH